MTQGNQHYIDSLILRQQFRREVEAISKLYARRIPQAWEDALHNVLDVIEKDP